MKLFVFVFVAFACAADLKDIGAFLDTHADTVSVKAGALLRELHKDHPSGQLSGPKVFPDPVVGIVEGEASVDFACKMARTSMTVPITVFSPNHWTVVPLLAANNPLISHSVSKNKGECDWHIGVVKGKHSLVVNNSCTVNVSLETVTPLQEKEADRRVIQYSSVVEVPTAAVSSKFTVTVPSVGNKKAHKFGVPPSAKSTIITSIQAVAANNSTKVGVISSSGNFGLKWTAVSGLMATQEGSEGDSSVKPEFHSEQLVSYFLGDGLMNTDAVFDYEVTAGELAEVTVEVPARSKVMHVDGEIDSWFVPDTGKAAPAQLRIRRSNPSLQKFRVTVRTEREINTTGVSLALKGFSTVGARREQGQLAVYRLTNLDVQVKTLERISRIDVSEASPNVTQGGGENGLIGVFKFSSPLHSVALDVKRHSDMDIVTCIIDKGEFVATVTEQGALCKATYQLKNMDKQYLVLKVDKKSEMWSAHVDGEPVKPASDSPGHIMVPIRTRTTSNGASEEPQTVEVVYFSSVFNVTQAPGAHQMRITVPEVDVPVLRFSVGVYVPDSSRYHFERPGKLDLLHRCHSHSSIIGGNNEARRRAKQQQQQQHQHRHARHTKYARMGHQPGNSGSFKIEDDGVENESHAQLSGSSQSFYANSHYKEQGTLPVSIEQPTSRTAFCHNRLISLAATSKEKFLLRYNTVDTDTLQWLVMEWFLHPSFPPPTQISLLLLLVTACTVLLVAVIVRALCARGHRLAIFIRASVPCAEAAAPNGKAPVKAAASEMQAEER